MFHFRLLLLFVAGFIGVTKCNLEVKLLHVLFRHGHKVPHKEFQNYPLDPHGNHSYLPMDSGDLTNEGKLCEYKIGMMLRERYNEFLGPYYRPNLVYGRSTDIPRARMSLQLVLAGLFPPMEQQIWNPHLPWLPVSTVSVPNEQDNLLFPQHCPRYVMEYKRFLKQDIVKTLVRKYKETMKYLTKYTGKNVDQTSAVYYLYNLFKEQAAQNLSLPEWTQKVYPNPMKEITALDFQLRSYTTKLKRLNGGPLLREITESMKAQRDETLQPRDRKAFLYSAHELNVAAMARALGTNDPVIPLYGSAIIFETLRDQQDNQYYVRILLWTGVTEHLITQNIPGCNELCPLEEFLEILYDVIPSAKEIDNCYNIKEYEASTGTSVLFNANYLFILIITLHIYLHSYL